MLTSRFPYPLEKGDKLRIYYQIKELSLQHEVTLISLSEYPVSSDDLAHLQQFCTTIHILRLSKFSVFLNLINGIFRGLPLQVSYFYNPRFKNQIQSIIQKAQPNHIYCQLIRMAPYVRDTPLPKTLDYMDAFSVGMQRRADRAKGLTKWLFNWEARRLRKFEAQVFHNFNHCTIISEQDRDLLDIAQQAKILIVPNGVDIDFFQPNFKPDKKYQLAFVGNMGYYPNVEAAKFLVQQILPKLTKINVKTLIAGARPTQEIRNLQNDQVVISGWVEDIREAYASAEILVAPIFLGSGQQNKILEAMSMGIPCITTTIVNNAIHAPVDKAILIADDAAAFAQQIQRLLIDKNLRSKIGHTAREFIKQKYSWKHSVSIFAELFDKKGSENEQ